MYPSLISVDSCKRWYAKKETAQEKLTRITQMEEKLAEKKLKNMRVGATIYIRGRVSTNIQEDMRPDSDDELHHNDSFQFDERHIEDPFQFDEPNDSDPFQVEEEVQQVDFAVYSPSP